MLAANEVSRYINNQIISGLVSHFRCYLNRSVRLCELSSYRFTSQPTHADHPAERPRKIFSSAQFCSTSRWISLFYFCAGWQGSESCWQRLSEISNANSDFVYFWTGGWRRTMPAAFFSPDVGPRNELWLAGSQQRCLRCGKRERILSVPLQSLQITRRWAFPHALLLMY